MLNRRSVLLASLAAGVAMTNKAHARAAQPATPVDFDVPALACDCHTHIHGDVEKFPFFAGRVYMDEPSPGLQAFRKMNARRSAQPLATTV